ncbi:DNA-dependent ATPase MGS1 [Coccidioides immitis RMSCC 3703]|uniref:DNA-dependent ATPase MGS1 n=1 Tax=Coccidioides immitis RMSCC 3703 TaxID=454286 RepID=A0A0J8QYY1_COCIT|nr:DNA-dependent ATPase MGS1 [Coccidioides immitis RMSCC 3703]
MPQRRRPPRDKCRFSEFEPPLAEAPQLHPLIGWLRSGAGDASPFVEKQTTSLLRPLKHGLVTPTQAATMSFECPICGKPVRQSKINSHIDSNCKDFVEVDGNDSSSQPPAPFSDFFQPLSNKSSSKSIPKPNSTRISSQPLPGGKRTLPAEERGAPRSSAHDDAKPVIPAGDLPEHVVKRPRVSNALEKAAPLAERMRPRTLDEVCGQELVGQNGVLRGLIEADRVPSMILWGGAGTGKSTIARVIATMVGSRFVEINSTSSGVAECKKIFAEARNELRLAGRKTIIFCDEIHRFSKSQQDVFLGPVESGQVTLIGATTENPSFKVQNALLSRCRTFTLSKLTDDDIISILNRALELEGPNYSPTNLVDEELIRYLAAFADGDARTSLNLLELAMDLSKRPGMTKDELKKGLTRTLVYDRAGDQHYDTISAFHKSIRGSDPDAALYYLARMIQSGEDPFGKDRPPRARINLAHATVALSLSQKSTRAYRALGNAFVALQEPGIAGLPIPIHLRNAPTKLMKGLGYGQEYKYNPDYAGGKVAQTYLPDKLQGRHFLEDHDLGTRVDPDLHKS